MTMQDDDKKNNNSVNSPKHYQGKNMEAIDVIDEFDLNFNLGNVVKYVLRSKSKDTYIENLLKACWYLEKEINKEIEDRYLNTDTPWDDDIAKKYVDTNFLKRLHKMIDVVRGECKKDECVASGCIVRLTESEYFDIDFKISRCDGPND